MLRALITLQYYMRGYLWDLCSKLRTPQRAPLHFLPVLRPRGSSVTIELERHSF